MSSVGSKRISRANELTPAYRRLLDLLPAAIYICDEAGYVTYFNKEAVRLWGRTPEVGKDLWCGSWKMYSADNTPIPLEEGPMAQTLRTGKAVADKVIIIEQPGGERFHVLPHPNPVFDDQGRLTGAINMLVDVSAQIGFGELRKETEELSKTVEALRRSEERYSKMVAEVQDYAIILLSREGLIENWNMGAEKIKGYREEEVLGKHFRLFYPPEDQQSQLPERLMRTAAEMGKVNHEGWRRRKDGSRFWASVSITALHNTEGEVIGFSKVTRDLTERRNDELRIQQMNEDLRKKNEMLRLSEERYHRMVAEVEDYVIILLSVDGYVQNWNRGAQKIKGYSAEEIIGKHFRAFYSPEDREKGIPEKLIREAALHGKALHEGWRIRKDGSRFWGSATMTALHNEDGHVIGFTKVTRDLTDKKLSEENLLKTSRALEEKNKELERMNEELSSFAYISSHDLQEPLRKIQTFSDRLMEVEYNNLSDKGKDYLRRMQSGASRMQKLIRDLLTYSRTTTTEKVLESTDLNALLENAIGELDVLITEKKARIEHDRLPVGKVIPFQIQQLFTNLLNNALKFSRSGVPPRIAIRVARVKAADDPRLRQLSAETFIHISFQDNGIGFEPEYSKKIFEVFQRLHSRGEYGGTGIGLAICKKIVENHDGILTAEGTPGEGATFHIHLPVVP